MSQQKVPLYTWEEIRKHNTDKDCWVVLYDRVLDVTGFLNEHPGGLDPICDLGGYDITNSFETIGHTSTALVKSKSFIIGEVDKSSAPPKVQRKAMSDSVPLNKYKAGGDVIPLHYIIGGILGFIAFVYFAMA